MRPMIDVFFFSFNIILHDLISNWNRIGWALMEWIRGSEEFCPKAEGSLAMTQMRQEVKRKRQEKEEGKVMYVI